MDTNTIKGGAATSTDVWRIFDLPGEPYRV